MPFSNHIFFFVSYTFVPTWKNAVTRFTASARKRGSVYVSLIGATAAPNSCLKQDVHEQEHVIVGQEVAYITIHVLRCLHVTIDLGLVVAQSLSWSTGP